MPNIYALEKNLEVKWKLNEESGEGFEQPQKIRGLFDDQFKQDAIKAKYNKLKNLLLSFIEDNDSINNNQLYEFTLRNMFLPKHSNIVLKQLQKDGEIDVVDVKTGGKARCGAFYQKYPNYRDNYIRITISKTN